MRFRYLFGPVAPSFADQDLPRARQAGECLTFGSQSADVVLHDGESWEAFASRLPAGWRPDFLVLNLAYTHVPACLWSATIPIVALAPDWNLLFHAYRHLLPRCELVLTDTAGVDVLQRAGFLQARSANLFGLSHAYLHEFQEVERDIDVLYVGNPNRAVLRERQAWLGRLARLADRRRVVITHGVWGDDYRALLRQARVVFNRAVRGECNRRAFEAAACGALLFQERDNREISAYFTPGSECVLYGDDDLESLLGHYLDHEDERRRVADAARVRTRGYGFEDLWERALEAVAADWSELQERVQRRLVADRDADFATRTWQVLSGAEDAHLTRDLEAVVADYPHAANLHHALGLAVAVASLGDPRAAVEQVAGHFRAALAQDPHHPLAALNLIEILTAAGQDAQAIDGTRRALTLLDRVAETDPSMLDAGHFPPAFDLFRVEWERAAWANSSRSRAEVADKCRLLRWRLHTLLADLTGDLVHFHEAALARPDLPTTRAALGCALGRANRPSEAIGHLRQAVAADPFDRPAARALAQALTDNGDTEGAQRFRVEQRLLHRAAPTLVPAESWFAEKSPVVADYASIIIPCCNAVEFTRLCLESILRHTSAPHELILVDNGSTDSTAALLAEVQAQSRLARVAVVRNVSNLGFAQACNQGAEQARGRYLVFLNNDTVVTEGWLNGLLEWPRPDAQVGLVGAVTNYAPEPQHVEPAYTDLTGLAAFAAGRRQEFANQALRVERLSGFCLLARREILTPGGGFDERFGLGFFEDDDLCVRVRAAGFQLLVAQNVYVHHFGSQTFKGLGLDARRQLEANFRLFQDKWGPDRSAGYHLPDALPPAETSVNPRVQRVSLCLIVKNEEANLSECLASAADLFDEIVVVDTGSTDRTRAIALAHTTAVHDFPWVDHFAAARNECLKHATGDWIFWLDADDRLDDHNREKLRTLFGGLRDENAAYVMKCVCDGEPGADATVVDHVRLFRNRPDVRWEHRVHEQILPAIRRTGGNVHPTDIAVRHVGYRDPALRRTKLERDLRLLHQELEELPDHPFTLFNLGSIHHELGQFSEAIPVLVSSLERSHPKDSIVRKLYALLAHCHRSLGGRRQALAACSAGLGLYADDAELLYLDAILREEAGDLPGAEAALTCLLTSRPEAHFASVSAGLRGYKARGKLADVLLKQGRALEAEAQWRQALREEPRSAASWLGLGQMLLTQRRFVEAEAAVRALESLKGSAHDGAALQARLHMAQGQFTEARAVLSRLIATTPALLYPRVLLSHALLQEGKELDAAERALLDVLAMDANNAEAKNNLDVLRLQRGNTSSGRP